jgi:hypothetical protein
MFFPGVLWRRVFFRFEIWKGTGSFPRNKSLEKGGGVVSETRAPMRRNCFLGNRFFKKR